MARRHVSERGARNSQRNWGWLVIALGVAATSAQADTLYVPDEYPTIQEAIDAAMDGDEVVVADGVYTGDGNRDMDFGGKAITVRSENGADACIIDLQADETNPHRAFFFHSGEYNDSVVDGFTIRNGFMEFGGSAIRIQSNAEPTIRRCNFNRNQASAAVSVRSGTATLEDCEFRDNVRAVGIGGHGSEQSITLVDCLFVGSVDGALGVGGFISSATVVNCTFAQNSRPSGGGAIRASHGEFGYAHVSVYNSLIWGNTPDQLREGGGYGGSISVTYSNVEGGWEGTGNIDANPMFVDPENGDFRLSACSPCIDSGDPDFEPEPGDTDCNGEYRRWNGRVDMGCDEFGSFVYGDLNCDAAVNALDIEPFILALFDPDGYTQLYPDCEIGLADLNGDGFVNAFDIEPFIELLF